MRRKAMIGAIVFALFLCLLLHMVGQRDKRLFAMEDTREYIEQMGEKYGTDIKF
ncbi:MAG: hypothetical protein IKO45_04985 [Clostridia bacterium]|nr:hypothetical protein [Clostridia bacterium]MBR4623889.1 hypothetical protein [Clostridia bacterium]